MNGRFFIRDTYYYFLQNLSKDKNNYLTLDDFLKTCPDYRMPAEDGIERIDVGLANQIRTICDKMVDDSLLIPISKSSMMPFYNIYLSVDKVNSSNPEAFQHEIDYGAYDFKYQGFQFTRNHFYNSVLPIVGTNKEGNEDIGTCFYIGDNKFATAAHCITGLKSFNLLDSNEKPLTLKEIWFAKDRNLVDFDLAIITVEETLSIPDFEINEPEVLDDVLVMGYPPIPGLNPILTAETASVGAFVRNPQKGAVGQVVSNASTYFNDLNYFLINARVKGGNSGGPVINNRGKVIGIVVQIPLDSVGGIDGGRFDVMGYGVCLEAKYLKELMVNPDIHKLSFYENSYVY